ncbi:MAG: coenzyme F420 hydrogenase/dehydrogenase beta subunit N-terminal domain-containing protein, partial [Pseudomonadota bacterium]
MSDTDLFTPPLRDAEPRSLCTDCGISRSDDPKSCGRACQFIRPNYPRMEAQVHGRARNETSLDETHFGVFQAMHRARLANPADGAQWTGITTRLAQKLLEDDVVDAVATMAPDPNDRWKPIPVLVTNPTAMAKVRGMRMGYAPLL